jgi:NADH:ubiquinone oxidoreductase subunit F (NADH-binding)
VTTAGLRGRGGAGDPTGAKMRAVAEATGRTVARRAVVVANGCETEPGSHKDNTLLRLAPHLVLDGAVLAAAVLEATEVVVCVRRGDIDLQALTAAIAARDDAVAVRVVAVPRRHVAGEASALVNFLTTGDPRPTTRPPRTSTRGVHGHPTLVDNVETLAHVALIARHGPDWFRALGHPWSPGSRLITVNGAVRRPGVHEVATDTPLAAVVDLAGGCLQPPRAALAGGWGGTGLPAAALAGPGPDVEATGPGILTVLPEHACGLAETANILEHLARSSAGQCGPCAFGLPTVADDFARLVAGPTTLEDQRTLHRHLGDVRGRGACAHPDGAARLAASALDVFADDLHAHHVGRPCPGASAPPRLSPELHVRSHP